jgi:hypothetical protein
LSVLPFPISAMTSDAGDYGDRHASRAHPSPLGSSQIGVDFSDGHPRSSQIGVGFTHWVRIGVGFSVGVGLTKS